MKSLKEKTRTWTGNIVAVILLLSVFAASPVITRAQEIPREEVVFVASAWSIPGWNPLLPDVCWASTIMYPSLYLYSPYSDEWIPYAAESYQWLDKYTLHVKIRDEAEWWDGEPITAGDYKYTLELGKKYVIGPLTPIWDYVEAINVIDDKTVQIVTSDAKLNYFQLIGILDQWFLPKHRWEALEADLGEKIASEFRDDVPAEIVGAGPYKLLSWTEEGGFYYVRVDDWWGKNRFGLPRPKYIAHRMFKDNVAAALAFEAGEIDIMTHFTPKIWELWEVKGLARRTYYAHSPYYIGGDLVSLYINYKYPLDDLDVRRAIAHVVPFDELISKAYFNYSIRAAPVPIIHTSPAAQFINDTLVEQYKFEFNLTKAKQILDDAGIVDTDGNGVRDMPDGTDLGPFTIQVPYGWTDWMMMCEIMATNLQEVGINVVTEFPDFAVWWERLGKKEWDLVIGWDAGVGFDHPWNTFRFIMDPRLSHPSGNWENYANPEVTPLIDAAPKESDPVKLMAIYSKLQEMFLRDLPGVPLFYGAVWYEYSEDYWVGWPAEENGWWFANFFGGSWPSNMPAFFYIAPKGETPSLPDWVTESKIPTSQILEDLAAAPSHGYITVTTTVTTTSIATTTTTTTAAATTIISTTTSVTTTTTTTTKETTVPTMDPTSVAAAGVVALIVGLAVGWLGATRRKP